MRLNTVIRKKGGVYSFVELSLIVSFHALVNYELFVKKKNHRSIYHMTRRYPNKVHTGISNFIHVSQASR